MRIRISPEFYSSITGVLVVISLKLKRKTKQFMCMGALLAACLCIIRMPGASGGQRASDPGAAFGCWDLNRVLWTQQVLQMLWCWSKRQLWATCCGFWELKLNSPARAASLLNCWAISSPTFLSEAEQHPTVVVTCWTLCSHLRS